MDRDNVIEFRRAKKKPTSAQNELFPMMERIAELEDIYETLVELRIDTRDELADLIRQLEAAANDADPFNPES